MAKKHKYIEVVSPQGTVVPRPNKTAAGMTKTAFRSNHNSKWIRLPITDDCLALTLSVSGTLDTLARTKWDRKYRTVTYVSLNDKGRSKLAQLRSRSKQ